MGICFGTFIKSRKRPESEQTVKTPGNSFWSFYCSACCLACSFSVQGIRKVFDDHAARLQAFKNNTAWLAAIVAVSALLVSFDNFSFETNVTAVFACLNNIGPGLELVGPMGNFADFSPWSKLLLSFDMLAGRLEIFPMLLLFAPSIWRRKLPTRPAKPAL